MLEQNCFLTLFIYVQSPATRMHRGVLQKYNHLQPPYATALSHGGLNY